MSNDPFAPDNDQQAENYSGPEEFTQQTLTQGDVERAEQSAAGEHTEQAQQLEQQPKDDPKRFQYWQSRAAKLENQMREYNEMAPLVEYLKANPQILTGAAQGYQQQVQGQQEQDDGFYFPDPPSRPEKPRNYSREEAISDPSSASAQYDLDMQDWLANMQEYNYDRSVYVENVQQQRMEQARQEEMQRQQMFQQTEARRGQLRDVAEYVMANHGLSQEETVGFLRSMSDPGSVTIDNLVQLYRMQNGGSTETQQVQLNQQQSQQQRQPSPQFQQMQRAQQTVPPMGVMNSQNTSGQMQDPANQIFDQMLKMNKGRSAF